MRVYLTSPWIPAEWIRAHGHEPHGIWCAENFRRDTPLSAGVCAFAEYASRFAEAQPDAAVIFTTACDQMRRGIDAVNFHNRTQHPSRALLFNLPATQTPVAKQIYRAEVERLGQFLLELNGSPPTPESLQCEMRRAGEARRLLRHAAPTADARSFAKAVAKFHHSGAFSVPAGVAAENRIPLALVGGPLPAADWNLFEVVEDAGGRIALNASKSGERSLSPTFEGNGEPFDALVSGYFDHIVDVYQRPNARLYAWLKPRLAERQIRGIVLRHFTGCDLWRAEAQTLRQLLDLPVLLLEADEAAGISPREVTRLQAFVETLK